MVAIPIFIYLFLIVFGILSLILFFKIWGMCNDMRALKDFVTTRFTLERHNPVKHDNAGAETSNDINSEILCIHDSDGKAIYYRTDKTKQKILFIDGGETGKINRYGNSSYTSIIDGNGTEYVYLNAQAAIIALFHYLNEGRITDSNLYTKKSVK